MTEPERNMPLDAAASADGKSTDEMLRMVLASYHRRGHPADLGAALQRTAGTIDG